MDNTQHNKKNKKHTLVIIIRYTKNNESETQRMRKFGKIFRLRRHFFNIFDKTNTLI